MWPVTLSFLNLPIDIRTKSTSLFLVGIIPGPKEAKNMNPYLEVLIDELLDLPNHTIYDSHRKEPFAPHANIVLHILNYPGQNKVFKCTAAGCAYCKLKGEYSKNLNKMVYLLHRRSVFQSWHDEWKEVVCNGIIKFCIHGLLGTKQRSTLFKFCDIMSRLCCQQITENIDDLELETHQVLALMERDYPVSLHVIVFHLLHRLPYYLHQFGPVYGYWMYPFERFNSWISRRVLNQCFPEATVLETYRLYERLAFSNCLVYYRKNQSLYFMIQR